MCVLLSHVEGKEGLGFGLRFRTEVEGDEQMSKGQIDIKIHDRVIILSEFCPVLLFVFYSILLYFIVFPLLQYFFHNIK